jgi:hypothetical protein
MTKNISHIVLSIVILLNGMGYSLIQADFVLNRDAIAELFCINQDKPELACDGKCELDRRLGEAQEHEENRKTFVQEEVMLVYTLPAKGFNIEKYWKEFHPIFGVLDELEIDLINYKDFFHPPQC